MIASDQGNPAAEKARGLKVFLIVFCVELAAVALLWAGYGVTLSLAVAIGGGAAVLVWPWLVRTVPKIAAKLRSVAVAVGSRVVDRRNYQFGIRSLLFVVLLIALVCAWFGYRQRQIVLERWRLDWRWQMVYEDGTPIPVPGGKPMIVEFSRESYTVNPLHEPKWLDFHGPLGDFEAIYRWDDDEIVVMQVSGALERPSSFDPTSVKLKPTTTRPGTRKFVETASHSTYRLRRVRDE
jgi:hypothetical protein